MCVSVCVCQNHPYYNAVTLLLSVRAFIVNTYTPSMFMTHCLIAVA